MNPSDPQTPSEQTPPQQPQFNTPNPTDPHQPLEPTSAKGVAKNTIGIVVGIFVALIVSLIVGAAVRNGLNNSDNASDTPSPQATSQAEETSKPAEALTATYINDYKSVCDNSATITNSATHQKPYKVAPFYRTALEKWGEAFFSRDSGLMIEGDQVSTVNTVACLQVIESSLKKATSCTYDNASVDLYTAEYAVTYRDPATGKEVAQGSANVTGSDTKCPSLVGYKKENPRFFAIPDKTSLDAVIDAFVNS